MIEDYVYLNVCHKPSFDSFDLISSSFSLIIDPFLWLLGLNNPMSMNIRNNPISS